MKARSTDPWSWYETLMNEQFRQAELIHPLHPSFKFAPNLLGSGPTWWGDVKPAAITYRIEVRYLDTLNNPHSHRPHVFVPFMFPRLPNPHRLSDGSLCLDYLEGPIEERWVANDGILTLINWSCFWLLSYEEWTRSGRTDEDRTWPFPSI